ncbi:MAG: alpha/beta hydrolase [Chloroflexi bacterium]|nr:MAG: alpha/beta hydrolase [Chloroflexota bacterium]
MAEETLRRNLYEAFDPGPGFPNPLLLSRTMAALEAAEPAADRRPSRGRSGSPRRGIVSLSPADTTGRLVAAALVLLLLLASVGAVLLIQHYLLSPTPARWSGCGGSFQCASITVPLDYSNRSPGSIEIATIRKPATDSSHRIGSLILDPGGPGISGIDYLRQDSVSYESLNKRFDLVGFDQRGVGRSASVRCLTNAQIDALIQVDTVLDDPREKQIYIEASTSMAQACEQTSARLLPFVDTASAARDLDAIRAALGDSKLTYLGFGYGSFLGETYAHLFPTHVRALVFDGVADPALGVGDELLARAMGFEANLQAFLADCRSIAVCAFGQAGDPGPRLAGLIQKLDQSPLPVGPRSLGGRLAIAGLIVGLDPRRWRDLDGALNDAANGDGQALLALADVAYGRRADGSYLYLPEAQTAITCVDQAVPSDLAFYDQLGPALVKASPIFGPAFQYAPLDCSLWPVKSKRTAGALTATGAPPILLLGGTQDPSWPYAWAQAVNSQLARSVLLTRNGYGFLSYFRSLCVSLAVNAYLTQLALPPAGTVCASDYPA